MNREMLAEAVRLAETTGRIFVATADAAGLPHIASAARLTDAGEGKVSVSSWFCPGTVDNLEHNRRVAVVVWDAEKDDGFQLLGEVERVEQRAIMDGYDPRIESATPIPQVERAIVVRVNKVIRFTQAPHSDLEE